MLPVFQSVDPCSSEMCDAFAVLANPRWKDCWQENTNVNTVGFHVLSLSTANIY